MTQEFTGCLWLHVGHRRGGWGRSRETREEEDGTIQGEARVKTTRLALWRQMKRAGSGHVRKAQVAGCAEWQHRLL